jgi:hypothetical protein
MNQTQHPVEEPGQPWWWPVLLLVLYAVFGTLLVLLSISLGKDKLGLSFAGSICNPKNTGWPPADAVTNFSKPLKIKD